MPRDFIAALSGKLSHADLRQYNAGQYNAVQKLAYLGVVIDLIVLDAVEHVERKRSRELRFRIGRRKPVGIEKERLRAVV